MRIIHLSDLHFGTESEIIVNNLISSITQISPDLIVISGDFTQLGNSEEYNKARKFIKILGRPVFCVPGNHDIPRYDLVERLLNPYKKYRKFISTDLSPVLKEGLFVIAGLNTARPILPHWNWAHGSVSDKQLVSLSNAFAGTGHKYRICVMHHPIHKAEKSPLKVTVFGAAEAMQKIHDLQVDLVLTGHVHYASITKIENTVFASASTAISHRLRSQENGFNVIDLHHEFFEISHFTYGAGGFVKTATYEHTKNRTG